MATSKAMNGRLCSGEHESSTEYAQSRNMWAVPYRICATHAQEEIAKRLDSADWRHLSLGVPVDTWLQPLITALQARIVWAILALTGTGLFGAYIKDRQKFAGCWHMAIRWTPEHARHLFGGDVAEPHSAGRVAVTYGHGPDRKGYWGLAYFELFSGTALHARLCVELEDMEVRRRWFSRTFPFVLRSELKDLQLRSRIREKATEFNYGPWAQYRMVFDVSTGRTLNGRMVLVQTGDNVGEITARRTA